MKKNQQDLVIDTIPIANPAVVAWVTQAEGVVLVNCDTGISIALNSTGMMVWELIDGSRSLGEIAQEISERFIEVPDCVEEDVDECIRLLVEDGFIGYEVLSY
jgi:hypothetical protein